MKGICVRFPISFKFPVIVLYTAFVLRLLTIYQTLSPLFFAIYLLLHVKGEAHVSSQLKKHGKV